MLKVKSFSFLRVMGHTVRLFYKSLDAWRILLVYSGILTLLSISFSRWSYSCNGNKLQAWCYNMPQEVFVQYSFFGTYILLILYLIFSFLYDIYNNAFKNTVFKPLNVFRLHRDKVRKIVFLLGSFLFVVLCIFCVWKIVEKPANPDWRIEFIYFVIAFICAILPILLIRISAILGYFLQDGKIPSFKNLFSLTYGRSYVSIAGFICLLFLFSVINLRIMGEFNYISSKYDYFVVALLLEFADYFCKLVLLTLFICFFRAQYEVMEEILHQEDSQIKDEEKTALSVSRKIIKKEEIKAEDKDSTSEKTKNKKQKDKKSKISAKKQKNKKQKNKKQ